MKKYLLFLLSILFIINSSFAFTILDSNDLEKEVFSINSPIVKVETTQNLTNFSIKYSIDNSVLIKTINFTSCSENYCGTLSLTDLILNDNNTFSGSTEFEIFVANESKIIYFDFTKPNFNLDSFEIDSENKKLFLNFSYSDNTKVNFIKIYKKDINSLEYITTIENETNYTYNLVDSKNLILVFKIEDIAQNELEVEEEFIIGDIYSPIIESTFLEIKDSIYTLTFKVRDDNLYKYELIKSDQTLSGSLYGNSEEKIIQLPYFSGEITLRIIDENLNKVDKIIRLENKFSTSFPQKYSNKKEFEFTSTADECILEKIGSQNENDQFVKDYNDFKLDLDIDDIREYDLIIFCSDETQKEYYYTKFFYDTNKPSETILEYSIESDGTIDLFWNESEDNESSVLYILYRDGDRVYSGSKEEYSDSDVIYPNSYEYYLKVEDDAGNQIKTESINLIPKKVDIIYSTNLNLTQNVNDENFRIILKSEKDSNVKIEVKNSNKIIYEKSVSKVTGNELVLDLKLVEGQNIVKLILTDDAENEIIRTYTISYIQPTISKQEQLELEPTISLEPINNSTKINNIENKTIISKNINESEDNIWNWFWIILSLILVLYLIFYILDIDLLENLEKKRKEKERKFKKIKTKTNNFKFNFSDKKKDDSKLGNSLEKIKQERIKKLNEKIAIQEKIKKEKENKIKLSSFQKKKLEDISKKEKFNFDIKTNHIKNKTESKKVESSLDLLVSSILLNGDKLRKSIKKVTSKKEIKKEEKSDELLDYLGRVQNSKSYTSSSEYLLRTEIKKQKLIAEKEKAQLAVSAKEAEKKALIEAERAKKEEKKQKKEEEKRRLKEERALARESLNEYLNTKKSKKSFYFAEKFVNKDLKRKR